MDSACNPDRKACFVAEDQLTALGAALERARLTAGLSKTKAAQKAGVARSTWDTLIRGYVVRQGRKDPITPTLEVVTRAATAVGLKLDDAAALAGYELTDAPIIVPVDLTQVPTQAMLDELGRRAGA